MRVPLRWLDEWVPVLDHTPESLAEVLVGRGFPVEAIHRAGHAYERIVVGEVLEVAKHPDADRLVLCRVNTGGTPLSIVCGAPNVVAGMRVPVALPGAVLPDGREIKKSKIRGAASEGMLCSGRELEMSDDHAGILALEPESPIGQPLAKALGLEPDVVLELEVHYNRPDVLSIQGVAREVSAALGRPLRDEAVTRATRAIADGGGVPLTVDDREGCPRYVGLMVRNVRVGPSPRWMQERLERAGVRPIHNVVDVTNYVLLELGQPMHAFDLAKLHGPQIRVRRAAAGESVRTLDGRDRTLAPEHLVIADRDRAIALAGIMGGAETEVTESTTDVLLESAYFDAYRVQSTANALGMRTEASRRFGRGADPNLPPVAAARAAELLRAIDAGTPDPVASEAAARRFPPLELSFSPRRASDLLGADIPGGRQAEMLRAYGFAVDGSDPMSVTVPTRRRDILEEVDLIEEVGRAYGLENLPDVPAGAAAHGAAIDEGFAFEQRLRAVLVGLGFHESLTSTLVDPRKLELTWGLTHRRDESPRLVTLANPPSPEASALRADLANGLLQVVAQHLRHGAEGTRVFEVGRVFESAADAAPPLERRQVAFAIAGLATPESWEGEREVDFYDAKGVAEALFARLHVDRVETRSYSAAAWKAGEAAAFVAESPIAFVGRVEPRVARAWKIDRPVYLFLAAFDALREAAHPGAPFTPFGRHPAVKRDLAFFVPEAVTHADIEARMRGAAGEWLVQARLFDVYRGAGAPAGMKSLAYSLSFAHPERTLQEREIEEAQAAIVRALAEGFGARLRERPAERSTP